MSAELSPEPTRLIAQKMAIGHYSSEEELLTEAVRLLRDRGRLREQIASGTLQLENGQFTDYDSQSLRQRLDDLKAAKIS